MTNKLATREWIAPKLVPLVRIQPDVTGQVAYDYMIHRYKVKMNDAMVSRALKLAHEICEGQENEQYAKLRDYANELLKRNSRSTIRLQCTPYTHEFYRMYICLEACKMGFLTGCRPLINLDGRFFKGYYSRQLLSAVSQDGNNSFYVIAYDIVNVENKENWIWFLENLANDLGDLVEKGFTFISDRQKLTNLGLDSALQLNKDAAKWLNDIPADRWSRSAFDTVCKNQAVTSNMCEKFNGAILKYKGKPIITMFEGVRMYITRKMVKTQALIAKSQGPLCKQVQMKLDKLHKKAIYWTPHWSEDPNRAKFEVTCPPHSKCAVDLKEMTCSCRSWELSGIPCEHAIACIGHNAGERFWETTGFDPIQTPIVKRKPGKPKTKRKKSPEEDSNPHKMKRKLGPPRCSRCKQVGHKKTSCKANLGDGDTVAATNKTRPSDVPVDGANEETRAS
ncbi:uncharacterized protein LOC116189820 [Punica granatum]|uniref:Uncharacterized protein LOC116189820 n=1 Tax=Punica granatum TaxID=22663 RepID=A0A6P8BYF3_PUNGR|nr:uncharacterized protein LOC116189820 [Punica granatum]